MATSKTLTPTNVTIQIPAFTDKPDQRVNSNCIDKEADAINALSDQIAKYHAGTDTAVYMQERYVRKEFTPAYLSGKTPNQFAVCVTPLGDTAQPGAERWFVTKGNGGFTVLCRTSESYTLESTRDFDYIVQII